MRIWLKYIGRALQLLTCVHDPPLFVDLKIPPCAGLSAGGVWGWAGCAAPARPPPPPPPPNPRPGPALLHQLYPPPPPKPPPPPRPWPGWMTWPTWPASIWTITMFGLDRETSSAMRP